jgi:hypothetical protein
VARKRTLMRENVKSISSTSVSSEAIETQRKTLAAAQRKLDRMAQNVLLMRERIALLRHALAEVRDKHKQSKTRATTRAVTTAINRLDTAIRRRDKLLMEYRDLKQIVRDQTVLCRQLGKKEEAKQKAVAKFLKDWERNYDREIRMKEKNVRQRKRLTKANI